MFVFFHRSKQGSRDRNECNISNAETMDNYNKLAFSLFKLVRGESKQFSIVHLHKIFKKSNLNDTKLVMDGLGISSYINAPSDL